MDIRPPYSANEILTFPGAASEEARVQEAGEAVQRGLQRNQFHREVFSRFILQLGTDLSDCLLMKQNWGEISTLKISTGILHRLIRILEY